MGTTSGSVDDQRMLQGLSVGQWMVEDCRIAIGPKTWSVDDSIVLNGMLGGMLMIMQRYMDCYWVSRWEQSITGTNTGSVDNSSALMYTDSQWVSKWQITRYRACCQIENVGHTRILITGWLYFLNYQQPSRPSRYCEYKTGWPEAWNSGFNEVKGLDTRQ